MAGGSRRIVLAAVLILVGIGPAGGAQGAAPPPLPTDEFIAAALRKFPQSEPSLVYAGGDTPFAMLLQAHRIELPLAQIPKRLRAAILAVEDARFYKHGAVDVRGMARAALRNLAKGRVVEGGSTITQQLAKILFLSSERTFGRKLREVQLAREIERRYSKDRILELYLNLIYFGHGAYGVEAAARTFFGKSVGSLSLPEIALLAGLPKAPTHYSPHHRREPARQRRDHVLRRMLIVGAVPKAEAEAAARAPIRLAPFIEGRELAGHFLEYLRQDLEERLGKAVVAQGGLKVYTTLDPATQRAAVQAVSKALDELNGKAAAGHSAKGTLIEGALLALDPRSGAIQAMVGGARFETSQFNRAVQARRQPGSAFKPLVYAAAFDRGLAPFDLIDDAPVSYPASANGRPGTWSPENADRKFRGPVTLRQALEESINVPAVRLLEQVGLDPVIDLARHLGITGPLQREYGLALGISEVSVLELVSAYATFANGGVRVPSTAIRQVVGRDGAEIIPSPVESQRVVDEEVAFLVTSVLEGVVQRGTGGRARALGRPVAAKTGTTQEATDLGFVGYPPSLAAGVWLGYDTPKSLGRKQSAARGAAPMWVDFMRRALTNVPPEPFPIPDGVTPIVVNRATGAPSSLGEEGAIPDFYITRARPLAQPPTETPGAPAPEPAPAASPGATGGQ